MLTLVQSVLRHNASKFVKNFQIHILLKPRMQVAKFSLGGLIAHAVLNSRYEGNHRTHRGLMIMKKTREHGMYHCLLIKDEMFYIYFARGAKKHYNQLIRWELDNHERCALIQFRLAVRYATASRIETQHDVVIETAIRLGESWRPFLFAALPRPARINSFVRKASLALRLSCH
jgi:hypothetical protein